jgi:serine/threonine protein kinase
MATASALKGQPLATVAGYGLTRLLARGGMADIYRARPLAHPESRWLALKLMRGTVSQEPVRTRLFEREVRIAAQIRHPNVVRLVDTGNVGDRRFLVMEYLGGRDAESFLGSPIRLPPELVAALGAQAAEGLAAAHRAVDGAGQRLHVVHRDVSPGNLRVDWNGRVKVLDFGVARLQSAVEPETQTGVIRGKFSYMSPEQADGSPLDARSDVFSLGVVLYELLTGIRAFRTPNPVETLARVKAVRLPRPGRARADVPAELDGILARCLAKDRALRFADAGRLAKALEEFLQRRGVDPVRSWSAYLEATCREQRLREAQELEAESRRFWAAVDGAAFRRLDRSRSLEPKSDLTGHSLLHGRDRREGAEASPALAQGSTAPSPSIPRRRMGRLPAHALRGGRWLWWTGAALGVLGLGLWWSLRSAEPEGVRLAPVPIRAEPGGARAEPGDVRAEPGGARAEPGASVPDPPSSSAP